MTTENPPAPPEKPESCEDKPFGVQLGTSRVDDDGESRRKGANQAAKGDACDDELIVGIDLGTTFSLIAAIGEDGAPFCVSGLVPSVVHFAEDGEVTVGWPAREKAIVEPKRTVFSVKRLMGKGMDEVETELDLVPYSVVDRDQKLVMVRVGEKDFTPQEVSALILKEIKKLGEEKLGHPVKKAVITVPAYFDDAQRQATRDAGRIAGLDVLRIVNEPTAAALAYGLGERGEGTIAVYDLGGGTFDCSILRISGGVFQVLSTNGDTRLGGDDIDRKLMELAAPEIEKQTGKDPRGGEEPVLLRALREAAEKTKCALSSAEKAELVVKAAGVDYRREVTRAELDALIEDLVERTIACCRAAVKDAGLCTKEIDEVVMVGGSTRVPRVRERVGEYFGRAPHTELDPDQVVALGAAVQANILAGGTRDMLLLDVTPLSLGMETFGGAVSKLIMRNSTVPARATEEFTTFVEGQTSVDIHIVQGEREMAKDCRSLGRFKLRGLPPMPAGIPRIEVGYLIDENGILTVTAIEKRSGRAASVEIVPSHGLTGDEVDRMVSDSIEHAAEDIARHRLIALRNEAETVLRATDGAIDRHRGILDADLVRTIEASSAALRDMLMTSENPDELHKAIQKLTDDTKPLADIVLKVAVKGELEGSAQKQEQEQEQEQEASTGESRRKRAIK